MLSLLLPLSVWYSLETTVTAAIPAKKPAAFHAHQMSNHLVLWYGSLINNNIISLKGIFSTIYRHLIWHFCASVRVDVAKIPKSIFHKKPWHCHTTHTHTRTHTNEPASQRDKRACEWASERVSLYLWFMVVEMSGKLFILARTVLILVSLAHPIVRIK